MSDETRMASGGDGESLRTNLAGPAKTVTAAVSLPIRVISLRRTPHRFEAFLRRNAMPGVEISRFEAIDGKTVDRSDLIARGIITEDLIFGDGALGCALSHIELWRHTARHECSLVICEDDAVLRNDFAALHSTFTREAGDFDIAYWGFNLDMHVMYEMPGLGDCISIFDQSLLSDAEPLDTFQRSTGNVSVFRAKRLYGTLCYTVSAAGARRLLRRCLPLGNLSASFPMRSGVGGTALCTYRSIGIDIHLGVALLPELTGFVAIPPIAVSPNDKAASTIGDRR